MITSMRTIVDLPDEQLGALARLCERQKISRAEAVRRAVDRLIKESKSDQKNMGFGIWKHKNLDSRKFVEQLRNEWSRR
jgi:metal-responsive CopG/Arc/MetJ family transcriptional regulator